MYIYFINKYWCFRYYLLRFVETNNKTFVPTDGHLTYEYIDFNLVQLNVFSLAIVNVSCAQLLATHHAGLIYACGSRGNDEQGKKHNIH